MEHVQISNQDVTGRIRVLRGTEVMLDNDLAEMYGVETRIIKRAVRRNVTRFPSDFMFEPTADELKNLRSQIVPSKPEDDSGWPGGFEILRSQNGISKSETDFRHRGGNRYAPFAFTELGVAMLSSILNSETAIQINIEIMRAFVQLRGSSVDRKLQSESMLPLALLEKRCDTLELKLDALTVSLFKQASSAGPSLNSEGVRIIQKTVADRFGVTVEDLKSADRSQSFTLPRHIAIYLVRNQLGLSLNEIGRQFGGRDHATILSALRKVEHFSSINSMIDSIRSSIQ